MRRGEVLGLRWLDVAGNPDCLAPNKKRRGAHSASERYRADGPLTRLTAESRRILSSWLAVHARERVPSLPTLMPSGQDRELPFARPQAHLRIVAAHERLLDLQDVSKILGHKDLRMTNRYAHLSSAHLVAAVTRLDAIFAPEMAPDPEISSADPTAVTTPTEQQQMDANLDASVPTNVCKSPQAIAS